MKFIRILVLWIVIQSPAFIIAPSSQAADAVVGGACTETEFNTAFNTVQSAGGGMVTFNCGASPLSIVFTAQKFISANTIIQGGDLITLSGGNAISLFQVFSGQSLTLSHITLSHGLGPYGAIQNFGTLNVNNSQIVNNTASLSGGAIDNYGDAILTNVTIANNNAAQFGGGVNVESGTATISNCQFSGNTATSGGGGIAGSVTASLTIGNSQFSSNKVTDTFAQGGAIRSAGTLGITQSTFFQNNGSRGGALFVASGPTNVTRSTINGNWSAYGGGIRQEGGDLTLTDLSFVRNGYASNGYQVTTGGGAISWGSGNATLTNVTISDNWASYGGGFDHANGTTTLTNVTISDNAAVGSGAFDQGGGSIALTNVTIAGNAAPFFAGGIGNRAGTLTLKNTLLSGNLNSGNSQKTNCYKPIATSSFSLSSDFTCGFGTNFDNVSLPLFPLASSGGFTQTHMLPKGSPAIDTGTGVGCPPTDQRGVTRPQGAACDVGAVEYRLGELPPRLYLPLIDK